MRKMNVQTAVVEELARKNELEAEAAAAEARCGGAVHMQAWRFSFFASPITYETLSYANDRDYLGYAILVSLGLPDGSHRRYIYESVIVEPSFRENGRPVLGSGLPAHYVHSIRRHSGWVVGHRFTLLGGFFSQQNNLTNVCGHAALRCVLNNLPVRTERIMSYEDINRELEIDHRSRQVGRYATEHEAQGLYPEEILEVIENHGWRCILAGYQDPVGVPQPYWRFTYSIIESGFPVLVFFRARSALHVICVIGHTLNTDVWDGEAELAYSGAPRAQYLSSARWMDHFVIHDDNYGMYFCMPSKALLPTTRGGFFEVTGALGVVPTEIELRPLDAELLASLVLRLTLASINLHGCYWLESLRQEDAALGKWFVLRTLFASRSSYQQHLEEIEDVEGNALTEEEIHSISDRNLPEQFWVVEITLTDIYTANKRKLGEILFDLSDPLVHGADSSQDSARTYTQKVFSNCLLIRLPGNIVLPDPTPGDPLSGSVIRTAVVGHVPLLRTCGAAPFVEW